MKRNPGISFSFMRGHAALVNSVSEFIAMALEKGKRRPDRHHPYSSQRHQGKRPYRHMELTYLTLLNAGNMSLS